MAVTRRYFLKLGGMAAAAVTLSPLELLANGDRDPVRRHRTLVILFLRGGVDGLSMVPPHGEDAYHELRPSLAIRRPSSEAPEGEACIDLDGFFGLHPRMEALRPAWEAGELAVLPAVGNPRNNRSHFAQQDVWETARLSDRTGADGWLNRHLQTSRGHGPLRAVSIGPTLPRILRGEAPAQAIRAVDDLAYRNRWGDADRIARDLEELYGCEAERARRALRERGRPLVEAAGRTTLDGLRTLEHLAREEYTPEASYPEENGIAEKLRHVAHLIKADVGLEVAEIDVGGWDTHQNQGERGGGSFAGKVRNLSRGMAAFARDLEDRMEDVLILTMSEFGRTARQNGTGGTDHGHATCLLALGGPVIGAGGGRILGEWPGLAREQLHDERDLAHATDFRDVIGELCRDHLGNPSLDDILPGHDPARVGLLETSEPEGD